MKQVVPLRAESVRVAWELKCVKCGAVFTVYPGEGDHADYHRQLDDAMHNHQRQCPGVKDG